MMSEQDYINLERQFRDRQARTELAFKACAELVKNFSKSQAHPLYPAAKSRPASPRPRRGLVIGFLMAKSR